MSEFVVLPEKVGDQDWCKCESPAYLKRIEILDILTSEDEQFHTVKRLTYFKNLQENDYPLNLNESFKNYKFDTEYELLPIETYLMKNKTKLSETKNETKIFTLTNVLTRIMKIPYVKQTRFDDFTLHVIKFKNALFVVTSREDKPGTHRPFYNYKFKKFCCPDIDSAETLPDTKNGTDKKKKAEYLCQTQLNDFNIIYTADIAGVYSDHEIKDLTNLTELNKCRLVLTGLINELPEHFNWKNHPKMLLFWSKSYLWGVTDIYVGFISKDGFVRKPIQHVLAKDLPKNQKWKPEVTVQSLHKFLTIIKNKLQDVKNCPYTVHEFKFDTKDMCVMYKQHEGKTEHSFLKEKFITQM